MRPVYLTGEQVYLRAHVKADAECPSAWYDSPLPLNSTAAEKFLKEEHRDFWTKRHMRLVICRVSDDTVVGGVVIHRRSKDAHVYFHMAPWLQDADRLRAEALRLLVAWLRDDLEFLLIHAWMAADEEETAAAANELGLREVVRLRQFVARPGRRVDRLCFEWTDARMETAGA